MKDFLIGICFAVIIFDLLAIIYLNKRDKELNENERDNIRDDSRK